MNNVVAKILIVLQLVFSICFMCFAGAVYSFQKGWRDRAESAETRNGELSLSLEQVRSDKETQESSLNAEVLKERERADVALAKVGNLQNDLAQSEQELANKDAEREKHLVDLGIAQEEAEARGVESNALRQEVEALRDQLNTGIKRRRELDGQKLDLQSEIGELSEREEYLHTEIARLRDLLRLNEVDPDEVYVGTVPAAIQKVDGVVRQSRKNTSRTVELVEISVGTDDGINKKMKLIVYRGRRFICEIEVTDVYPDMAVGRVLEETRNGTIERGDHVTTKL